VQAAVHQATRELLAEVERDALTVPLIAARAGVTPSTVYRRWGDLADLLADVAMERLRPETEPADTGTVQGDLLAWAELYLDEMSSEIGLSMIRDVLAGKAQGEFPVPCQCAAFTASQLQVIVARGAARNQPTPEVDALMDGVVAPIIYRALFAASPTSHAHVQALVEKCMADAATTAG
jgi:AcrR family transcriptional regulator